MNNPLVIKILEYLRGQSSSCSLLDLINVCEQNFVSLIGKSVDLQLVLFQKNFFVMNALYQIQRDIQIEGFLLTIFPLDICMVSNPVGDKPLLTKRDVELARYYLDWSNLKSITAAEVDSLFSFFWRKYSTADKVDAALTTLGLDKKVDWIDIRRAYKKKVSATHPDKGGLAEDFIEIREAYEVLNFSYHVT